MKRRQWTSQEKLKIILEGLSGQIEISRLCAKYQINQTQYYQWRDQLLKYGNQAFEQKNVSKKEQHLEQENIKLKRIIGDLTVELKKSEYDL
jgi:transposase-like protein